MVKHKPLDLKGEPMQLGYLRDNLLYAWNCQSGGTLLSLHFEISYNWIISYAVRSAMMKEVCQNEET